MKADESSFGIRTIETDESGASLILALIFTVAIAALLIAIVNLSGTNLKDTVQLQNQRDFEYAADAAVDGAIQAIRYQSTISSCSTTQGFAAGPIEGTGIDPVVAFCSESGGGALNLRQVTVVACDSSNGSSFSSCSSSAVLVAHVEYNDVDSSGTSKIGNSVSIQTWDVKVADG